MSVLFDGTVSAQKDRDHYFTDWESNVDGHLMIATGRYLEIGKQDVDGFKEYMRAALTRPFVEKGKLKDWFSRLGDKVTGDGDIREDVLEELRAELGI